MVVNRIPWLSVLPELTVSLEATYDPFIGLLLSDSIFSFGKVVMNLEKGATGMAKGVWSVDRFSFRTSNGICCDSGFREPPWQINHDG